MLYDTMEGAQKTADVKIALVPYNHTVKVSEAGFGEARRGASSDGECRPLFHLARHRSVSPRSMRVSSSMPMTSPPIASTCLEEAGADWGGCVVARPYPHDVNATPVTTADGDTFFVPWFAPDEEGVAVASNGYSGWAADGIYYHNSYLDDEGGECDEEATFTPASMSDDKEKGKGKDDDDDDDDDKKDKKDKKPKKAKKGKKAKTPVEESAQTQVCKYRGQKPSESRGSTMGNTHYGIGPNLDCPKTNTITPLTKKFGDLRNATRKLTSGGNTDIVNGFMWSWHNLTPYAPFPKASDDRRTRKNIVLMTDGVNTYLGAGYNGYAGYSGQNKSGYSSYEYLGSPDQDLIGDVSKNGQTEVRDAMNNRFLEACANARAAGISIWTIGFRFDKMSTADRNASRSLLSSCASLPTMFLEANSDDRLKAAFKEIAAEISKVRIVQ